jgi:hypothetical protein
MRKIWIAMILLAPALAWAEPRTAAEWYNEGENQYNLGNFDKAAEAFKQGFSLETNEAKKPAYLFNVAQSYRQANDCKNAHFFYKRFLALEENDTVKPLSPKVRKDVEDRIADLEACAQQAQSISKKPPNSLRPDDPGDKGKPAAGDPSNKDPAHKDPAHKDPGKDVAVAGDHGDETDEGDGAPAPVHAGQPHVLDVRLTGGGTKISAGTQAIPVQATFALTAGYPIPINSKLIVEAGAALTVGGVPYTNPAMGATPEVDKTALFTSVMANGAATYEVAPKIGVRADVGLGALLLSNVSESFFTAMQPTSGALTMFHVRAALSAEYAVTPNFIVTVPSLAFSYSPPKSGLADDIKSLTSFDFLLGVSYRM